MEKPYILSLIFAVVLTLFLGLTTSLHAAVPPKNLILVIVDGMGPASITGARLYKGGSDATLNLEAFPHTGYVKTYSNNEYVTDSAAAATTLATGVKANNSNVGVSSAVLHKDGSLVHLKTLFDYARKNGKTRGLITNTRLTHATPAAFYAHVHDRSDEHGIASFLIPEKLDIVFGGGRRYFHPTSVKDSSGKPGRRKDGKNYIEHFKSQGTYVANRAEFSALSSESQLPIVGLFSPSHMSYESKRDTSPEGEPSLHEMVQKTLELLKKNSPNGYILVIEAGRVDHAAHKNATKTYFEELLSFDSIIPTLLAEKKDTLILVTADHETGGLSLNGYIPRTEMKGERVVKNFNRRPWGPVQWATLPSASHTAVDVPILSAGPGSEAFLGYQNNSDIIKKVLPIFNW